MPPRLVLLVLDGVSPRYCTRASLVTGRDPVVHGIFANDTFQLVLWSLHPLRPRRIQPVLRSSGDRV